MSKTMQWAWDCAEKEVDQIINTVKENLISKADACTEILKVQNVNLCDIDEWNVDEVIETELEKA